MVVSKAGKEGWIDGAMDEYQQSFDFQAASFFLLLPLLNLHGLGPAGSQLARLVGSVQCLCQLVWI
jgi:hypothetical protein